MLDWLDDDEAADEDDETTLLELELELDPPPEPPLESVLYIESLDGPPHCVPLALVSNR